VNEIKRTFILMWCLVCVPAWAQAQDCYLLTAPIYGPGFFSVFNTVIGALDYVEKNNVGITVDFQTRGHYYDESVGPNWWCYYFEPICIGNQGAVYQKKFVNYQKINFSLLAEFQMPRQYAHDIIKKYVRLKPHVQKKIDEFMHAHFDGNYVIGVHYRGTDKSSEAQVVPYDDVYQVVLSSMQRMCNCAVRIFVATDEAPFLQFMQEKFADKVCAIDAMRSENGKAVHTTMNFNNYKKGEDAIIDCILLSRSDLLIKMASNLSDASMKFNPDLPVIHLNKSFSE